MNHSPTPWGLCNDHDNGDISIVTPETAATIATVTGLDVGQEVCEANALFLQLATTHHDELLELLDDVSAAMETVMARYGKEMPPADQRQRDRLVAKARAMVDALLRPDGEPGEEDE